MQPRAPEYEQIAKAETEEFTPARKYSLTHATDDAIPIDVRRGHSRGPPGDLGVDGIMLARGATWCHRRGDTASPTP